LSWNRPARWISNFVRASDFFPFPSPWGSPRTMLGDSTIGIAKIRETGKRADVPPGTVGARTSRGVDVACADEWVVVQLLFRRGEYISAKEVLKTGDRFTSLGTRGSTPCP
jgi:methionyl-tRNA formyltransferase